MTQNYGNSFGIKEYGKVATKTLNVWHTIDEEIPVGAVLAASEDWPEGKVIPLGTPVSMTELGGAATVGASADMSLPYSGLLKHDTVMGSQCATLCIVKRGNLLIDRVSAEISAAQKIALAGRISFYPEL